jgi:hypothetical protein
VSDFHFAAIFLSHEADDRKPITTRVTAVRGVKYCDYVKGNMRKTERRGNLREQGRKGEEGIRQVRG